MKMSILGNFCYFPARAPHSVRPASTVDIALPESGRLLLNKTHRFIAHEHTVQIPMRYFTEGENTLSLEANDTCYRTESLIYDGKTLRPAGFSEHEMTLILTAEVAALRTRVEALEKAHAACDRAHRERALFG